MDKLMADRARRRNGGRGREEGRAPASQPERESDPPRRNPLNAGNDPFRCRVCGCEVLPLVNGSYRSHCPECLWSLHVDLVPGDRSSDCRGLMRPVAVEGSPSRGWQIVHVCTFCGIRRRNRAADDDARQPDRWERIVELSAGGGS